VPSPANITYTFEANLNGNPVAASNQALNLVKTG
jgi:hypothetical protein